MKQHINKKWIQQNEKHFLQLTTDNILKTYLFFSKIRMYQNVYYLMAYLSWASASICKNRSWNFIRWFNWSWYYKKLSIRILFAENSLQKSKKRTKSSVTFSSEQHQHSHAILPRSTCVAAVRHVSRISSILSH